MLNIISEKPYKDYFDNVIVCETLCTEFGEYNLYREYIGADLDEDGDIIDGCGCYISLHQTDTAEEYPINELYNLFTESGDNPDIDTAECYISTPRILKALYIENYVDENRTTDICDRIKAYFKRGTE